jgi:16S rRNA (guanine527-N7)-methyltransferase
MRSVSSEEIARVLAIYNVEITARLCDQIRAYTDLLLRWNRRISLTTITEPVEILRLHFGESFLAVSAIPIRSGRLADVGSGPGFPAIPIRMASPDVALTLIESNRKKAAFLAEIVRELDLSNVQIHPVRLEELEGRTLDFDFITARAVAIDKALLRWSGMHLKSDGKVAFWLGRQASDELSRVSSWRWRDPIDIPQTHQRVILVGSRHNRTS